MHLDLTKIPHHVAIIMDGNGRWAKARGQDRIEGHRVGVNTTETIIEAASDLGIKYLTLYAFSKENWQRPPEEVAALMSLLENFLIQKRNKMLEKGIVFNVIGDLKKLPVRTRQVIQSVKQGTSVGKKMMLTLALSYGARDEILRALQKIIKSDQVTSLTENNFGDFLDTAGMPDPDLIIRTSGEYRMSNFLLWQGAYSEYVFEPCYWPDFSKEHLEKALIAYQKRERRYGKTSEQLK